MLSFSSQRRNAWCSSEFSCIGTWNWLSWIVGGASKKKQLSSSLALLRPLTYPPLPFFNITPRSLSLSLLPLQPPHTYTHTLMCVWCKANLAPCEPGSQLFPVTRFRFTTRTKRTDGLKTQWHKFTLIFIHVFNIAWLYTKKLGRFGAVLRNIISVSPPNWP